MRLKNKILPLFALIGLSLAVTVALATHKEPPKPEPASKPAQAPFQSYIGGGGIVESSTNNISIGTSIAGIVQSIPVRIGDRVKAGATLFQIDDRELRAELLAKQASLGKAQASLEEAKASLRNYAAQYALVKNVADRRAVSLDDVEQRRNAELLYKAKVESAKADVESAKADCNTARTNLERLTVRAPVDGEVLQVNIRPGEYAATGVLDTPLMRFGAVDRLRVRVDIDENDAWRFAPGARAEAYIRGNRDLHAAVTFTCVEPYVVSKTQLTGSTTERVDTRVLQVLYSFDRDALPVYVGQQMDVFIETPEDALAAQSRSSQALASGAGK
jgi:RND family efflux transporter MFP subunit